MNNELLQNIDIFIDKYKWTPASVGGVPNYTPTTFMYAFSPQNIWKFYPFTQTYNCVNFKYIGKDDFYFTIQSFDDGQESFPAIKIVKNEQNTNEYFIQINLNPIGGLLELQHLVQALDFYNLQNPYDPYLNKQVLSYWTNSPTAKIIYSPQTLFKVMGLGFNLVTNINQVNFFSDTEPNLIETISAKEYIIDLGNLEYTFEQADDDKGVNELYFEDSTINFKLSGIYNNSKLYDFFGINKDTGYYGYMIRIIKNLHDEIIWRGCVNQNSITEQFSVNLDSEIIDVQGLGFLKEFKNYYKNVPLPHDQTINWIYDTIYPGTIKINHRILLIDLLRDYIFDNQYINIEMESSIVDYYIKRDPLFAINKTSPNYNFCLFKSGYCRISDSGNVNCYDFLKKLCNAMGWQFYFLKDTLYIKNRSSNSNVTTTLNSNNFIEEYTTIKKTPYNYFNKIVLMDGQQVYGNKATPNTPSQVTSHYFYIFSTTTDTGNIYNNGNIIYGKKAIPFSGLPLNWTGNGWINSHDVLNSFIKYNSEDGDNWNYRSYRWNPKLSAYPPYVELFETHNNNISKNDTLFLDCGDTGERGAVYWTTGDPNYEFQNKFWDNPSSNPIGDYGFWYTGNYGNMLFKIQDDGKWFTYLDYVMTKQFEDNFKKLYDTKTTNVINTKYDANLLDNIMDNFTIINNAALEGTWVINKFIYDFKEETTELELQKKSTI
jgi:hypothetical protein